MTGSEAKRLLKEACQSGQFVASLARSVALSSEQFQDLLKISTDDIFNLSDASTVSLFSDLVRQHQFENLVCYIEKITSRNPKISASEIMSRLLYSSQFYSVRKFYSSETPETVSDFHRTEFGRKLAASAIRRVFTPDKLFDLIGDADAASSFEAAVNAYQISENETPGLYPEIRELSESVGRSVESISHGKQKTLDSELLSRIFVYLSCQNVELKIDNEKSTEEWKTAYKKLDAYQSFLKRWEKRLHVNELQVYFQPEIPSSFLEVSGTFAETTQLLSKSAHTTQPKVRL